MEILSLGPTDYVSGDPSLEISYPFTAHPWTVVKSKTPGDFKWVSMALRLPEGVRIESVTIGYQVSSVTSFISQVRLSEMGEPNQSVVIHDDATHLTSTAPATYVSSVAKAASAGKAVMLQLRLNYQSPTHSIKLGGVGISFTPATVRSARSIADLRLIGGSPDERVFVSGYAAPNDGGGGFFYWDALSADADNKGTTIQTTGGASGRWIRILPTGGISVKYFGAKGDGSTPDTDAIQATIDYALQNKIANVFMPDGRYLTSGPIHLGYGNTYTTVNLLGTDSNYDGDPNFPGVTIIAKFSNAPALVVQGGRNVKIKNICIIGESYRYGLFTWGPLIRAQTVSYQDVSNPERWVTNIPPSGLTRYAPYAGIAIDPYSGPRPTISYPDVRYPSWALPRLISADNNGNGLIRFTVADTQAMATGQSIRVDGVQGTTEANGTWTIEVIDFNHIDLLGSAFVHAYAGGGTILTQYNRQFSSVTTIENVTIDGFFVGVAIQPCDADANGDFTTIHNSLIMNVSHGVSVGNTQSRNVGVSDTQFYYAHTVFSTDVVGRRNGWMGSPIVNCCAVSIYQLFSFPSPVTLPVVFESLYVEEMIRLGVAGIGGGALSNPIMFNGCNLYYVGFVTGKITKIIYNVPFYEGSAPLTFNSTNVFFSSNFGLVTGRTGTVLIRNSALQASLYNIDRDTPLAVTDAQRLAYNYLLGGAGVLTEDRSLEGRANIVPLTLQDLSGPNPSLPPTDGFTNIASGRSQIHRYVRYIQYAAGEAGPLIPVQGVNMAMPIDLTTRQQATNPAFDWSTLTLTFTYANDAQANYNRMRIEPGCILWHENTNAMFIVDVVTADGTNWHVSATMVTNYWINQVGQYIPVVQVQLAGYLYLYQTFHKSTTYQYRGDTTSGSPVISNVRRSDEIRGRVPFDFKVGDLVFNNDMFWDNHLPPVAHIVATDVGSITIDKTATVTAVGVAIELYR